MFKPKRIDQTSPWGGQGGCPRPKWACRGPPNVGDEAWVGENCWRRTLQEKKGLNHEFPMESSVRNAHRRR
jgi:hypothetical protein